MPGAAPGCCGGCGGGEALPATSVLPFEAREAGIGGEVEFLDIFARAGTALGTFGGGMAGLLSWYVER